MIIESVLKNDIQSLNWYSYEVIVDAVKKYFPAIDSEGDFNICISGFEDGSREGGQKGLLFTIDKKLASDEVVDDEYNSIMSIKSSDIMKTIIMFAEDTNGNENPYIDTMFDLLYNDNDIEKDLNKLQNIFIEYMEQLKPNDPLLIKLSLIFSIAISRYNSFKNTVLEIFLENLG